MLEKIKLMITDIKISYYAHRTDAAFNNFMKTHSDETVEHEYWKDQYLKNINKLTKLHQSKTKILVGLF